MKYVFFGTPKFAAIILERMINAGLTPQAIVSNPDRPVGRKKSITPPPAKLVGQKYDIPVFQPELLNDPEFKRNIADADFFVVAAYGKIFPKEIIELPRMGIIGVHPSLLPKYRGASPIQGALLGGDEETGVTLYVMDEKTDHGPIIKKQRLEIKNENYEQLLKELAVLAATLLIETLPKFASGNLSSDSQDDSAATYTKKFTTHDAYIDPITLEAAERGADSAVAVRILRMIRAFNPEPGAWTMRNGKRMKLLDAEMNGAKLKLKKVQVEGKKPAEVKE